MREIGTLLRHDSRARLFFAAHAQSSLGTGAAYVALLVLAYDRLHSPWAISLILLADFVPSMFLGPLFGAAVDRWSRRGCAIAADILRAFAFVALALAGGFWLTLALALLAGVGTGLSRPAILAALPNLFSEKRLPAATSLYGMLSDAGFTLGPALAALGMLIAGPETLMIVNGLTFAVSAALLASISFGEQPAREHDGEGASLLGEAREGVAEIARMPGVRAVVFASSTILLFAGLFNVGELLLARDELGAGNAGFSILIAVYGLGVAAGSLRGAAGGGLPDMKRRYVQGLTVTGLGFFAAAVAPVYGMAAAAFAIAGFGNGLMLVHERLIVQRAVPDALIGRVFGLFDTAASWMWAFSFAAAGALFALAGTRAVLAVAGIGGIAVAVFAAWALRGIWETETAVTDVLPEMADRLEPAEPQVAAPAVPV
jgi:MFS family permease